MKNILQENMKRFSTKNLNETSDESANKESLNRLAITLETAKENLDGWVRVNGEHKQLSPILAAIGTLINDLTYNSNIQH